MLAATGDAVSSTGIAYVTNQDGGVSVIDFATMQVTKTIRRKSRWPARLGHYR